MKTVEVKVYQFDELSPESQDKAIESLYDINVDFDWYLFTYDDAKTVGLKITSFDTDHNSISGELIDSGFEVADKIIANHGESCDTYKLAKTFLSDWSALVAKHSDGVNLNVVADDNEYEFDQDADELEEEFKRALLEEYLSMLSQEYDYQTSREAIIETIKANEYDFTEDGKLY